MYMCQGRDVCDVFRDECDDGISGLIAVSPGRGKRGKSGVRWEGASFPGAEMCNLRWGGTAQGYALWAEDGLCEWMMDLSRRSGGSVGTAEASSSR